MSLLELEDIKVDYRQKGRGVVRAVAGVSLTVEAERVVGLVGESGCGKSTLARVASGLMPPTSGTVRFEGRAMKPLSRRARSREDARLQLVFQDPYTSLNPRRSVGSQIADGLRILGNESRAENSRRVGELLEQVGLSPNAGDRYPHQFSGGQRQRVAIARALAADPSVIVLDEPLSSLDSSAQAQVANLLIDLSRELGIGMLLISHDLAIVRHLADTVAVMYLGVVVESGETASIWSNPLHPYSEALIGAVPRADGLNILPAVLPGEVPDPARPPAGCRFHPRCPYAMERCLTDDPERVEVVPGRTAACWLNSAQGGPGRPTV
jgi:oligopeptide/dipeptide ABC transporter ATP-binding protein